MKIPAARIATQRRDAILQTQEKISAELNKRLVGKETTVLLEEQTDAKHWIGRTAADAPEVDQTISVKVKNGTEPRFARVRVTGASVYDLEGTEL